MFSSSAVISHTRKTLSSLERLGVKSTVLAPPPRPPNAESTESGGLAPDQAKNPDVMKEASREENTEEGKEGIDATSPFGLSTETSQQYTLSKAQSRLAERVVRTASEQRV